MKEKKEIFIVNYCSFAESHNSGLSRLPACVFFTQLIATIGLHRCLSYQKWCGVGFGDHPGWIAISLLQIAEMSHGHSNKLFCFDINHRWSVRHFAHDHLLCLHLMQMVTIAMFVFTVERWAAAVVGHLIRMMIVHAMHRLGFDFVFAAEHARAHDAVRQNVGMIRTIGGRCHDRCIVVHVDTVTIHVLLNVLLAVVIVVDDERMVWCAGRDWRRNLLSVGQWRKAVVMLHRRQCLIVDRWWWCGGIGCANHRGRRLVMHCRQRQVGLNGTHFCGYVTK